MKIKYQNFLRNNFFLLILLFAVIVVVFLSYNRFIVRRDYIVEYEGNCDPTVDVCFIGCEDDECIENYYYFNIQKYAADLYGQCGEDITDCEEANVCLPEDHNCSITYCDVEVDGDICTLISESNSEIQNGDRDFQEKELLQDNNDNNNI